MLKKAILFFSLLLACVTGLQCAEQPKPRYVSLAPATTEILFALGLDEEIAAVSTYCNYPPAAVKKEKIGTFSEPSIEKILSLKPTLVFATGLEQAQTVERLRQMGVPVYVSDPATIEELFVSIKNIARAVHREKEAEIMLRQLRERVSAIREKGIKVPQAQRQKVFIEIWHEPLLTAGKGSFVDELIRLAGGINIAYDTLRPYSYFSPEQVIMRNPDCIILGHLQNPNPLETIRKRIGWSRLSAVKRARVYNIDPDILLRPGPRIVDGLEALYRKVYPQ